MTELMKALKKVDDLENSLVLVQNFIDKDFICERQREIFDQAIKEIILVAEVEFEHSKKLIEIGYKAITRN